MSSIPNVSSVYRDLSHIYTSANLAPKAQQPYAYDQRQNENLANYKTPFEDMYTYKQKRHNQLMSRLQNSYQEHKMLIGGVGGSIRNQGSAFGVPYSNLSRNQQSEIGYEKKQFSFHNNAQVNSSYGYGTGYDVPGNRTNKFVIPKIKYRHIQDQKSKNQLNQSSQANQTNQINQSYQGNQQSRKQRYTSSPNKNIQVDTLQRQFYQDIGNKNKPQKQKSVIGIQTQDQGFRNLANIDQDDNQKSVISNRTGGMYDRTSKNVKYEDKIESYYELCRKNINTKPQAQKPKQQKFMRGNSTKNKALKLDQAIKLLSLD